MDPGKIFTVAEFRDKAIKCIKMSLKNEHLPFIVGGTGLYIDAVVNNFRIPQVPPNKKLRASLEEKSLTELKELLKKLDPVAWERIDGANKRRLIRALEVTILTGQPFSSQRQCGERLFEVLQIGLAVPREVLYNNIEKRVERQLEQGLLQEVEGLSRQKYSWQLPSMSGIGYRQFQNYFADKMSLGDAVENLKKDTKQYAKRQLTWFRRNSKIQWVETLPQAERLVENFLKK